MVSNTSEWLLDVWHGFQLQDGQSSSEHVCLFSGLPTGERENMILDGHWNQIAGTLMRKNNIILQKCFFFHLLPVTKAYHDVRRCIKFNPLPYRSNEMIWVLPFLLGFNMMNSDLLQIYQSLWCFDWQLRHRNVSNMGHSYAIWPPLCTLSI